MASRGAKKSSVAARPTTTSWRKPLNTASERQSKLVATRLLTRLPMMVDGVVRRRFIAQA